MLTLVVSLAPSLPLLQLRLTPPSKLLSTLDVLE